MNEKELKKAKDRAAKAERLYKDRLIQEAFSKMEDDLYKLWKISAAEDVDGRERVYTHFRLLEQFRNNFLSYMKEGKLADENLKQLERRETAKKWPHKNR